MDSRTGAVQATAEDNSPAAVNPRAMLAVGTLCWREIVRFFRQRNRVIGAVGQPLLFWLLFGAGLKGSFRISQSQTPGQSFAAYYFPGTLMLIVLFTAIFTTISIIEDRREGFLQSVLVAPIPRWSMVLGKVLGGTAIALFQGMLFLILALTLQISMSAIDFLALTALLIISALALVSMGFSIAWRMESTQGFHAIMSLLLMPMWLLSGAFFPIPAIGAEVGFSQQALHWVMRINPMTYCVAGTRHLLFDVNLPDRFWTPSPAICWLVASAFALLAFAAAWKTSQRRTTGDLL